MNKKTLRSVLKYLSKYKFHIILSLILAAVSVGFSLYIPILIGKAIDLIVGPGNVDFRSILGYKYNVELIPFLYVYLCTADGFRMYSIPVAGGFRPRERRTEDDNVQRADQTSRPCHGVRRRTDP